MRGVDAQQFAAPRSPVGAETHAVERQAEHGIVTLCSATTAAMCA